jgi:hypothetical protein
MASGEKARTEASRAVPEVFTFDIVCDFLS